jgi:drug/metabolite transporter (DMT)-like permease
LLWAVGLDWIFWAHPPNTRMFVGGAVIIASGLYLVYRERRERLQPVPPVQSA